MIDTSIFIENCAEKGGALFAHYGSLQAVGCHLTYNRAQIEGGVTATSDSFIYVRNSTFSGNVAEALGGVVLSYNSTLTINSSQFITTWHAARARVGGRLNLAQCTVALLLIESAHGSARMNE